MADEQTTQTAAPASIEVRLSSDKLRLLVSVPDPHGNLNLAASRVAMELPPLELADPPDTEAIAALLGEACAPGENLVEYPLVEGQAPVPPRDGELQWQDDYFAEGFAVDEETGQMDYWQRAENRSVCEGDLLAVLLLPRDGEPGVNLQGNEVPVEKPGSDRLRAGKGVRTEEDEDQIRFYAGIAGRITLKDGTVSVDNVYSLKGDVSISTGNIHHAGSVVINGDVREGARIEADGDVLIKGLVEPATIVCGGNLVVGGGIVGDEEHHLEVAGTVQARYLNEVTLRCGGDVTITSQIDHSRVSTLGKVVAPRGRVAGGRLELYLGGQIGQAGAAGSSGTEIVLGHHWQHEAQRAERHERLVKLQEAREKVADAIARAVQQGALDDERRGTVMALKEKLGQIDGALQRELEANREADDAIASGARRELAVMTTTYPGVTFRIGSTATTSNRQYDMPRLIALRRDKVRILPLGDLNQPD
ncbi:DUF342 domain-containing protein [bacterium]|nr:DUF342 domain-containing protein [bacterium]